MIESLIEGNAWDSTPCFMCLPDSMGNYLKEGNGEFFRTLALIVSGYPGFFSFLGRQAEKIFYLFHFLEPYNNLNLYYFLNTFPWLNWLPNYPHLLVLAFPGMLYTLRTKKNLFFAVFFLLLAVSLLLAPVLTRYRLILIPFYCVWAGVTISQIMKVIHSQWIRLLVLCVLILPWTGYLLNKALPLKLTQRDTEARVIAIIQQASSQQAVEKTSRDVSRLP